ncbi:hypothetical protein NX059_001687 [Plenodomus lindquistii]|nr:hypothetical protein NX059_001687 [Plenodomus lindquistii]
MADAGDASLSHDSTTPAETAIPKAVGASNILLSRMQIVMVPHKRKSPHPLSSSMQQLLTCR